MHGILPFALLAEWNERISNDIQIFLSFLDYTFNYNQWLKPEYRSEWLADLVSLIAETNLVCCEMGFLTFLQTDVYNPSTKVNVQRKEEEMENLWLAVSWGSPIGVGIFLLCLGGMIYLISKADALKKRGKEKEKE